MRIKMKIGSTILILFSCFTIQFGQNDNSIWMSALDGDLKTVRNYIENGFSVDAIDENKRTPLMMAAFNGHDKLVKWLIDNKAEIEYKDVEGRTALIFSSTCPSPNTVELLLAAGADPNIADKAEGFTALMFAAGEGKLEIVKLLIEYGANPDIKDADGDTALNHAYNNGHGEVIEYLANRK